MIDRRTAIRAALGMLPAAWLAQSSPAGAQDFQKLTPFLIDLPGWTADKAGDTQMLMPCGVHMIRATRSYKRGSAKFDAGIVIGDCVQDTLLMMQNVIKHEISGGRQSTSEVDGYTVLRSFATRDNVSTIMVTLLSNAAFGFVSWSIPEHEAFGLARRFDWRGMQEALLK